MKITRWLAASLFAATSNLPLAQSTVGELLNDGVVANNGVRFNGVD